MTSTRRWKIFGNTSSEPAPRHARAPLVPGRRPKAQHDCPAAIEDLGNTRLFSVASAWEIAIKASLGKLTLTGPFHELVPVQLRSNSIQLLPIAPEHLNGLLALPFHHRDPFDRILVSQAVVESATLVSADATLDRYAVPRLW